MSYPTETFCAILQVQNYTDKAAIPEGREWEICVNTVTRTIEFPKIQWLMHFSEYQKRDNTSLIFRNPLNNLLKVFKRQNEKQTCYSSAFMELTTFCKDQCCHFLDECIYPFADGWKGCAVLCLLGWKLDQAGTAWLGEQKAPHSNTDAFTK